MDRVICKHYAGQHRCAEFSSVYCAGSVDNCAYYEAKTVTSLIQEGVELTPIQKQQILLEVTNPDEWLCVKWTKTMAIVQRKKSGEQRTIYFYD